MTTPANPDDLLAFLRAALDEDERVAKAVPEPPWAERTGWTSGTDVISAYRDEQHGRDEIVLSDVWRDGMVEYATRHDPARVLAEVDAKRRILDAYQPGEHDDEIRFGNWRACSDECAFVVMDEVIKLLALPYADRPGYREEWRPA